MSLIIEISKKIISIPKYKLQFNFSLPSKDLSNTVLKTYKYLCEDTLLLTNSSREEKSEAMSLLKYYGQVLFHNLIPKYFQESFQKENGIYIILLSEELGEIPWQLINDGSSFYALTQGICCLIKSNKNDILLNEKFVSKSICASFHSTLSRPNEVVPEEWLLQDTNSSFSYSFDNQTTKHELITSIENSDIFCFSGVIEEDQWILEDLKTGTNISVSVSCLLQSLKKKAPQKKQIMILIAEFLYQKSPNDVSKYLEQFIETGISALVTFHGKLDRSRMNLYITNFLFFLRQGKHILRAHCHALNTLSSEIPLSWDWSWIQLRLNQNDLNHTETLTPFFSCTQQSANINAKLEARSKILRYSFFKGNPALLHKIEKKLYENDTKEILCIQSADEPVAAYIWEIFRRWPSSKNMSISYLFYQSPMYHELQKKMDCFQRKEFKQLISPSEHYEQFLKGLETRVFPIIEEKESLHQFLIIQHPPKNKDTLFYQWLTIKQKQGWKVILITHETILTDLPVYSVPIIASVCKKKESQYNTLFINSIFQTLNLSYKKKKYILELEQYDLWKNIFKILEDHLNADQINLLISLFCLKVFIPFYWIELLFPSYQTVHDLKLLQKLNLIEGNLEQSLFKISFYFEHKISSYKLISESYLKKKLDSIVRQLISKNMLQLPEFSTLGRIGYYNCIQQYIYLKEYDLALTRNIQIGKHLLKYKNQNSLLLENVYFNFHIALDSKQEKLFWKALFFYIEILENASSFILLCEIYKQVLYLLEKRQEWKLIAQTQIKLAKIHIKMKEKDKAVQRLTSSIVLFEDLKEDSSYYKTLLSIAILLLELEEYEKLTKLICFTKFTPQFLNENTVCKLALLKAHLLFKNQKLEMAMQAFKKNIQSLNSDGESILLEAKTWEKMGDISSKKNINNAITYWLNAIHIYDANQYLHLSKPIHYSLYSIFYKQKDFKKAAIHLEKLYELALQENSIEDIQNFANQLGGLFFKIGDSEESTKFYTISQKFSYATES